MNVPARAGRGLATDLYELTMAQAYHEEGFTDTAVFDVVVRRLPPAWNHLVACGLPDVLAAIEAFRFTTEDVQYLAGLNLFTDAFLDHLRHYRFTGTIRAMPEGTPVFPHEPVLQVEGPLVDAQLLETIVLNQLHAGTLLASKAARVVESARGKRVIEFGFRRAHGLDAALKAARAGYVAGATATSNVLAGRAYGIPVKGTMAHSYVQAHGSDLDAFRAWTRTYPDTILLVDTYDTMRGVDAVIQLAEELGDAFRVQGIRIDSGDLAALALDARRRLDAAGLEHVEIVVSSGVDEHEITRILDAGAPVDGFGVGTAMSVSADAPFVDMVFKLAEYAGEPRAKSSPGKASHPGRKQVYRARDPDGRATGDVIALADEEDVPGDPLLHPVVVNGHARDLPALEDVRAHCLRERDALPPSARGITSADTAYPVRLSARLQGMVDEGSRGTGESEKRL